MLNGGAGSGQPGQVLSLGDGPEDGRLVRVLVQVEFMTNLWCGRRLLIVSLLKIALRVRRRRFSPGPSTG